jgi:hypothetical protein
MEIREAGAWAERQFEGAELGHRARVQRAVAVAGDLMRSPSASVPKACPGSRAKRAYELFSNKKVTHAGLLSGPVKETIGACAEQSTVLVVQDTTSPAFGGRKRRRGLGRINDAPHAQGMLVHTSLAVGEDGCVLGVLDQHVWARTEPKHRKDETLKERRERPRESERWGRSARVAHQRLVDGGVRAKVIHLADREGDIFELFEELDEMNDSFVIRATQNRATSDETYSIDAASRAPVLARKTIDVPARPGHAARQARLEVRAARVEVLPPRSRRAGGEPIWMNVVVVKEVGAPSEKEALEWKLLTREPIEGSQDVLRITEIYARRWVIEDFHMGLKTGCALEDRQLESFDAIANFLAIASAISVHLLQLRDASRAPKPSPVTDVLTPVQLKLLRHEMPTLPPDCSAQQALRAVAVLGGFYDTSKKTHPGWRTLYGGMQRLLEREAGYLRALEELQAAPLSPEPLTGAGFRE